MIAPAFDPGATRLGAPEDGLGSRAEDKGMAWLPWVDPENFNPGYLLRGIDRLPKQGDRPPWRHTQDYWSEKDELPGADLDDGTLAYG